MNEEASSHNEIKPLSSSSIFFILFYLCHHFIYTHALSTTGYTCTATNQTTTTYPCQTYIFYRAASPNFLDLASIADLFSVSRLMISKPSNISSPSAPLILDQPLLVPITCSCNTVKKSNSSISYSYANVTYTIQKGDTFYIVSTHTFQNLTTYQSVEAVNPTLIPTKLAIGIDVIFPIFCRCPQKQNQQVKHLISYVFQPSDSLASVAARFGVDTQSITDVNGNISHPYETIFIPVRELPQLDQPTVFSSPSGKTKRKGLIIGLAIGLGITGFLLLLLSVFVVYKEVLLRKGSMGNDKEKQRQQFNSKGWKDLDESLMVDVSDCLDKFKVFNIEELRAATDDFAETHLIEGSVYKGCIADEIYAIKNMKLNAYEELKILQKVNHGSLVKLEGFCIDPENAKCYLIYEYLENGSLKLWLLGKNKEKLSWKERLSIAVDVANGLQYIHEHTRPPVAHKDIKSSNILLDADMRAKISNFGLAKSGCNALTMHIVGTQGYIAPEYIADGVITTKMDVFSFGVVLLELISGKEVIDEHGKLLWVTASRIFEDSQERKLENMKSLMDESLSEDSFTIDSVISVMNIAIACVHKDPSKRPSTADIVYAFCKSDELLFDASENGLSTISTR